MALPGGGVVTFLMTDIEGSTRRWEQDPVAMSRVLTDHDRLMSQAVGSHAGRVVKRRGEGDSLFCVFASTSQAVAAALDAQQNLSQLAGEDGRPLRVRMAIHAGDAVQRSGDYYGPAVNRCARLRAIGHGGQVLLTMAAAELARDHLPPGARLLELGEFYLRDIARSEAVHQLVHPSLQNDFPPLESGGGRHGNVPIPLTSFVGRDSEKRQVKKMLDEGRLVTLVGPGGVGKSRLAIETGTSMSSELTGGFWYAELAPVNDSQQIVRTVAASMRIRDEPGKTLQEKLEERLAMPQTVLAMDNCEHLMPVVAQQIHEWLRSTPGLRVLATSREPLSVQGEKVLRLDSLGRDQAMELFQARASATVADANKEVVQQICDHLDRLPLAVELAAARASSIPLDRILSRLQARTPAAGSSQVGMAERQQTLWATVDWSYQLLDPAEQELLKRVSVFTGGFALEAAETICSGEPVAKDDVVDLLGRLVDKSLLIRGEGADGKFRYDCLQTVGEFARERLRESGDETELRRLHLECMVSLADEAVLNLKRRGQGAWLAKIQDEQANIRAAVAWSLGNDPAQHRRLVGLLADFWPMVATVEETIDWTERALAVDPEAQDSFQALLHDGRGRAEEFVGRYESALASARAALHIWELLGDKKNVVSCLDRMGVAEMMSGDAETAIQLLERCVVLSREIDDRRMQVRAVANLGAALIDDPAAIDRAESLLEEAAAGFLEDGDEWSAANSHNNLGDLAVLRNDFAKAELHYRQSIAMLREMGSRARHIAANLDGCAASAAATGRYERALRLAAGSAALSRRLGLAIPVVQVKLLEDWLALSRRELGPGAAASAWKQGEEMSFEALVGYALADSE